MEIHEKLNELLVKLFKNINTLEEQAVCKGKFRDLTTNDMHVIEAIGPNNKKNMSTVARALSVTMGTLTISVNGLVKKGYVDRIRSEEDRRVVLISLTEKGENAYRQHAGFHRDMIRYITGNMDEEEQQVLEEALGNLLNFFGEINEN